MSAARALLVATLAACAACHPNERFEAVVHLIRRHEVERSPTGELTVVDLELEWDACPGDQFQVVRGGREFAACTARYRTGDALPVVVQHRWDTRGFYTWDLEQVGACRHAIEPASEGSFERSQECRDTRAHGVGVGFQCSRLPFARLVEVCPWMAR